MMEDHIHSWQLAANYTVTQHSNQQQALVLAMYCTGCAEVISRIVPPPEVSPILQLVHQVPVIVNSR